jgi:hypothetical protein
MLISAPTASPTATAPNTPIGPNSCEPRRCICIDSGSIQTIRRYEPTAVSRMEA